MFFILIEQLSVYIRMDQQRGHIIMEQHSVYDLGSFVHV